MGSVALKHNMLDFNQPPHVNFTRGTLQTEKGGSFFSETRISFGISLAESWNPKGVPEKIAFGEYVLGSSIH